MKKVTIVHAENKNPWVEMHFGELGGVLMGKKIPDVQNKVIL